MGSLLTQRPTVRLAPLSPQECDCSSPPFADLMAELGCRGVSLTRLDLSFCDLGGDQLDIVAAALARGAFPALTHLDVSSNPGVGLDAVRALAQGVKGCRTMREVDVSECLLGEEGGMESLSGDVEKCCVEWKGLA